MTASAQTASLPPGIDETVAKRRVVICVGSGGVGKTTTSAVIALHAAIEGRKVLVCTVDPAKRLANSLGVGDLQDVESEIPLDTFRELGVEPKGRLFAMMLDMKHAFDRLVDRNAPDAATRERIFGNRFYRYFSTSLAGTQEYSAMERVYELYEESDYDLIVLDTPPTVNALDFLDAPKRLFEALDSSAFQWIAKRARPQARFGLTLVKAGAGYVLRVLSRLTGGSFLEEFSDFILSFGDMWEGFKHRAARTKEILSSNDVAFYVVTGPDAVSMGEAGFLHQELLKEGIRVGGFIVNRVHQSFVPQPVLQAASDQIAHRLQTLVDEDPHDGKGRFHGIDLDGLSRKLQKNVREFHVLATRDAEQIDQLSRRLKDVSRVYSIPFFSTDIYSLVGLNRIRRELFGLAGALGPAERTLGRL